MGKLYPLGELDKEIKATKGVFISIEGFESRFGSKEEHNFVYDYFINHENTTDAWKLIFNEWKEKGILN